MKFQFYQHTKKNEQISNFMKIRPVGAKPFNADAWTDRHDTASSFFSQCPTCPSGLCGLPS